ncbi:MAG: RecX family transcriptional regulator [Proteobacteria bacterium]|nr:RecX family transcriptional regulator [Pseudomonadota bacterium]
MERTITQLEVQQKNKKRVSVYLDDRYAFSLSIFAAARLGSGQRLTEEAVETLEREDLEERAYEAAVRFLGYRARSVREMRQYLSQKRYPAPCRDKIITKLQGQNYLNDQEFSRLWIEDRRRLNPKGTWALKQELLQKGITDDMIDTALAHYDEEEAAWTALIPKLRQWENADPETLKKKIYGFLSQRGFSYDTTLAMVDRALSEKEQVNNL